MNKLFTFILFIVMLNTCCFANDLSVKTSTIHLDNGERIVGFKIDISPAAFTSISGLQAGWNINVDNDPKWSSEAKGEIIVGAAALDLAAAGEIHATVEAMEHQQADKMDVSGIIYVTKDFETTREIVLSKANFIIRAENRRHLRKKGGQP